MNRIESKKLIFIFVAIVVSFVITNVVLNYIYTKSDAESIDLNKSASVEIISASGFKETADIDKYTLNNKGDVAIISVRLPESKRKEAHCIELTTFHCTVDAYYQNELIYSAGHNYVKDNKMIGGIYPCIEVPYDAWGENIDIRLELQEPTTISMKNNIKLYKLVNNQLYFKESFFLGFYNYIVIIFVSFIITVLTILNYKRNAIMRQVACLSMFSLSISVWGLTYFGYYNLISRNSWGLAQAEYMSLFYAASFLSIYAVLRWNNPFMKKIYIVICTCMTGLSIIATILNFTTEIHFVQLLPVMHVLIVVGVIPLFYSIITDLKNLNYNNKIFNYGFLIMVFLSAVDVLRLNLEKYGIINIETEISVMPIGLVVFVFSTIIFTVTMLIEYLEYDTERKTLLTMAYEDSMTGLANRAGCDIKLTRMDVMRDTNYAIIFMDLNRLKQVNDTYGHDAGDDYIINFAEELKEVFLDIGFCGRLGGDEFIVILEDQNRKKVAGHVDLFKEKLEEINKTGKHDFEISVAIGYATNDEKRNSGVTEIMKIADQRMYEDKSEDDR